ncbi:unnamed protein product [Amoebophrya sp. A25]|nr:unnamed protein product [Amoebophrya sp. A25]|eukprot:GSA25T00006989001.1
MADGEVGVLYPRDAGFGEGRGVIVDVQSLLTGEVLVRFQVRHFDSLPIDFVKQHISNDIALRNADDGQNKVPMPRSVIHLEQIRNESGLRIDRLHPPQRGSSISLTLSLVLFENPKRQLTEVAGLRDAPLKGDVIVMRMKPLIRNYLQSEQVEVEEYQYPPRVYYVKDIADLNEDISTNATPSGLDEDERGQQDGDSTTQIRTVTLGYLIKTIPRTRTITDCGREERPSCWGALVRLVKIFDSGTPYPLLPSMMWEAMLSRDRRGHHLLALICDSRLSPTRGSGADPSEGIRHRSFRDFVDTPATVVLEKVFQNIRLFRSTVWGAWRLEAHHLEQNFLAWAYKTAQRPIYIEDQAEQSQRNVGHGLVWLRQSMRTDPELVLEINYYLSEIQHCFNIHPLFNLYPYFLEARSRKTDNNEPLQLVPSHYSASEIHQLHLVERDIAASRIPAGIDNNEPRQLVPSHYSASEIQHLVERDIAASGTPAGKATDAKRWLVSWRKQQTELVNFLFTERWPSDGSCPDPKWPDELAEYQAPSALVLIRLHQSCGSDPTPTLDLINALLDTATHEIVDDWCSGRERVKYTRKLWKGDALRTADMEMLVQHRLGGDEKFLRDFIEPLAFRSFELASTFSSYFVQKGLGEMYWLAVSKNACANKVKREAWSFVMRCKVWKLPFVLPFLGLFDLDEDEAQQEQAQLRQEEHPDDSFLLTFLRRRQLFRRQEQLVREFHNDRSGLGQEGENDDDRHHQVDELDGAGEGWTTTKMNDRDRFSKKNKKKTSNSYVDNNPIIFGKHHASTSLEESDVVPLMKRLGVEKMQRILRAELETQELSGRGHSRGQGVPNFICPFFTAACIAIAGGLLDDSWLPILDLNQEQVANGEGAQVLLTPSASTKSSSSKSLLGLGRWKAKIIYLRSGIYVNTDDHIVHFLLKSKITLFFILFPFLAFVIAAIIR